MHSTQVLWDAFNTELSINRPNLIQIQYWILTSHLVVWGVWCEINLRRRYAGTYVLEEERTLPIGPMWLLPSLGVMSACLGWLYPIYCLYRATVSSFLPYLYFTSQPIPWPLSIFFSF